MRLHRYPGLFAAGAERTLWLAVAASLVLHAALFAAFGRLRIPPTQRTFFSPIHMVDLVAAPPGGGPNPPAAAAPSPPAPAPPAPRPAPKPEPKAAPAAASAVKAPPKPPTPAPKPPAAAAKPQPAEKVIPATPADPVARPEPRTEEQVAERIARMRERIEPREPAPPSPSPARTAMEEAKVSQRVASIRERVESGSTGLGPGSEPEGTVGTRGETSGVVQDLVIQRYASDVKAHLKQFWQVPPSLADTDLRTELDVTIDRQGNVRRVRVEKSSGSRAFDEVAERALYRASPLPPPPEQIVRDGVVFGLTTEGMR